jgi:CelD/BcsL family acetyltransferase involved in cellulose biosynthesis
VDRFRVVVEPLGAVEAAEAVWRTLAPRADAGFFTAWDWLGTWLTATAVEVLLATVHDGARLVAAGLFGVAPDGRLLLHETGDPAWDRLTIEYNDLLVARDAPGDPRPSVLAALCAQAGRRGITLNGVDARWLDAAAAAGLPARALQRRPTFGIALAAGPVIERLGTSTRAAVRQTVRRLGPVEGRPARRLDEAHGWLDALIGWHQASWQARGEPGAFGDPRIVRFHHALLERAWPGGAVELFEAAGPHGPFGYLLNFCAGDRVHAYQSGFVGGLPKRLKPGLLAHCLAADHHAAQQRRLYDLMAGDARYKRNLGAPSGELSWITVHPSRTRAVLDQVSRLPGRIGRRLRGKNERA